MFIDLTLLLLLLLLLVGLRVQVPWVSAPLLCCCTTSLACT
jgi:hypothetical protein